MLAAILSLVAVPARAADDYKVGDLIEVFFLNSWTPAVVIETDKRGNVLAEYEFAGGPKREVFKPAAVRAAYESGAILRGAGSGPIRRASLRPRRPCCRSTTTTRSRSASRT